MNGAFDVAFNNLKITHMTSSHGTRREMRVATEASSKTESAPVLAMAQLPARTVLVLLPCVCGILVIWSVHQHLPHVGTVLHLAMLQASPALLLLAESAAARHHVAVLQTACCVELFANSMAMRQIFVGYLIYVAVFVVLLLQALAVPKFRPVDLLLAASISVCMLSALLLRLIAPHALVVQVAETTLLMLCFGAYVFMAPRTAPLN